MNLTQYVNHLKKADKAYINEQILRIVQAESEYISDLNTSQLIAGIDSKGKQLKPYRNKEYAIFKNRINFIPGLGNPDLKLSGRFYSKFYLQFKAVSGWPISIFSQDSKTNQLVYKYGKDIFGLTESNLENLRDHIKPKIQELYARIFKL